MKKVISQKVIRKKPWKKIFFVDILSVTDESISIRRWMRIRIRQSVARIRIHTKLSLIHKTAINLRVSSCCMLF